jgi:CarD family transcriptional regulator
LYEAETGQFRLLIRLEIVNRRYILERSPILKSYSFKVGEKVVYPGHGVGEVESIVSRTLGGVDKEFFVIHVLDNKGTKIMVPVEQAESVGLRRILDKRSVEEVYEILKNKRCKVDTQTWNRRFRDYTNKLKTGSLFEIAEVIRDLSVLSADKELSYGEKKMLESAQNLLVSEVSLVKARTQDKVRGEIAEIFA